MKIDLFEDGELKEKKPKKQKKLKKVKKVEEAAEKIADKEPSKKSFSETIDFVLTLVKSILPNSVAMLKHLRLKVKRLNMTVTNEEADKTAIEYGEICAGIYTLLGTLSGLIKVKVKEVNICPDFINKKAVYDIYFTVKLRLLHILFALLGILGNFIKNIIKNKGK